jgi:hypothetical protein
MAQASRTHASLSRIPVKASIEREAQLMSQSIVALRAPPLNSEFVSRWNWVTVSRVREIN